MGRELHDALEVKDRYTQWFTRMCEYGFDEGKDFCSFLSESTGGRPSTDHQLTIPMAKEICMIQRTEKGKEIRRYFIETEKQYRQKTINTSSLKADTPLDLPVREYNGQRVLTFSDIDSVHGRPDGTASRNFRTNRNYFIEDEDYFKVCRRQKDVYKKTTPVAIQVIHLSNRCKICRYIAFLYSVCQPVWLLFDFLSAKKY